MPQTLTYPGIYVEEVPSGVHPIAGASTSDTAFVDYFARGPVGIATRVTSLAEHEQLFGGPDPSSAASYAVRLFFQNGGQVAWIVRVLPGNDAAPATANLSGGSPTQTKLAVSAANPGQWGSNLQVAATKTLPAVAGTFNLFVREHVPDGVGGFRDTRSEVFRNLTVTPGPNNAVDVVNASSALVSLTDSSGGELPQLATPQSNGEPPPNSWIPLQNGHDATVFDNSGNAASDFAGKLQGGLAALDRIQPFRFNILCLPATARLALSDAKATIDMAAQYAGSKGAFAIVDPPPNLEGATAAQNWLLGTNGPTPTSYGAVYFPRVLMADPLAAGRQVEVGPSGLVAGIYTRTDAARGTWKAPAGIDATLIGAVPAQPLNDADSGQLNPIAINALRTYPVIGSVVWGARTLFGADQRASEWKYIPVRRMALYIENSLIDSLGWVVFEPNDEPLWAQIRLNVGAFMQDLFRQAAFQGQTPKDAYLVKCDRTTTTQTDIDKGVVNIIVGFAPLKPAEFVVIQIQQLAGQSQS